MLKPSFKSLEGSGGGAIALLAMYILYTVNSGDTPTQLPIDQMLEKAQNLQEFKSVLDSGGTVVAASEASGVGKSGVILWFVYKLYSRFTVSRTELKKKEIEFSRKSETTSE